MVVQMTELQLQQVITDLIGVGGGDQAAGAAAVVGPIQDQEIQKVGRLDSGCRKQDYIPQLDDEQTAGATQEQKCQISGARRPESGS